MSKLNFLSEILIRLLQSCLSAVGAKALVILERTGILGQNPSLVRRFFRASSERSGAIENATKVCFKWNSGGCKGTPALLLGTIGFTAASIVLNLTPLYGVPENDPLIPSNI